MSLERGFAPFAEGSCLIKMGMTHVLVTATVDDYVPRHKKGSGEGWITAEYAMLPRSGRDRNQRDSNRSPNGRSLEIQRLIGRSLRSVVDLRAIGERTIIFDCDVIQADGGTRTASITAAYIALVDALAYMKGRKWLKNNPVSEPIAAVSVGIVGGEELLDLCYSEDSRAGTDMNVVMTASNRFVEVQGTAEGEPYTAGALGKMLTLGSKGVSELIRMQRDALGS